MRIREQHKKDQRHPRIHSNLKRRDRERVLLNGSDNRLPDSAWTRKYLSANLWSALLGIGEIGMMISMILGYFLAFVGIGLFAQWWRELYKRISKSASRSTGCTAS